MPQLPLMEAAELDAKIEIRPTWRGWIHAATFPVAIAAGIVLIVLAQGAAAKWACAVFMATSLLLFGNSALYHRFDWSPKTRAVLKRIDHANILLLIAGTYTPIAVLALPTDKAIILLSLVWGGAILGILFRIFWIDAPRWLYVALYLVLGWAAVMYMIDLFQANAAMMILVIVGGVLYTVGAVVYALKRPNPWPGHFGFHEIFHVCTVLAFLCHWTACLLIALNPAYHPDRAASVADRLRRMPRLSSSAPPAARGRLSRRSHRRRCPGRRPRWPGRAAACCSASSSSLMSARTRPRRIRRIMSQIRTTTASARTAITTKPHGPGVTSSGSTVGCGVGVAAAACARAANAACMVSSFRAEAHSLETPA